MREAGNGAVGGDPSSAIEELTKTRVPSDVERLADQLAGRAIAEQWTDPARGYLAEALLRCLTGDGIRQDPDAEDAICSALESIGVMRRVDNLVFEFVAERELTGGDLATVRRYRDWLPIKYRPRDR